MNVIKVVLNITFLVFLEVFQTVLENLRFYRAFLDYRVLYRINPSIVLETRQTAREILRSNRFCISERGKSDFDRQILEFDRNKQEWSRGTATYGSGRRLID